MEWNKVMNFGDPSTFGTEMADRFVASGANLPPPVSNRVKMPRFETETGPVSKPPVTVASQHKLF